MNQQDDSQQSNYEEIMKSLRTFIEFSLLEDEKSWSDWIAATVKEHKSNCWEKKQCKTPDCPAYNNDCGRCWLIAGTLCGGKVQGKFAKKYNSCLECEVYQEAVYKDSATELREHILILIHSLISKQLELKEALEEVKVLSGLIPICMDCKKIRDDRGFWNQLETYISKHSEAKFSHGICPDCIKSKHPEVYESIKEKHPDYFNNKTNNLENNY